MKKTSDGKAHGGLLRPLLSQEKKDRARQLEKVAILPRLNLNERQLCDLELLINGAFTPLTGFMTEEEYISVLEKMRLPNGILWPMPIVLDVGETVPHRVGDEVVLCDSYGNPLALFLISSVYIPNKDTEALHVYGTKDVTHPGVRYIYKETKGMYLGGKITGLALNKKYDFLEMRHTPEELRAHFKKKGWNKIIFFQTRNPLHRAHFEMIKRAHAEHKAQIVIHPAVGLTKEGDIDYITRVRAYRKLQNKYLSKEAMISLLPIAMRMAGPREVLWHAIIRKNYGATHFIVGRDHAGPGKNTKGVSFYGPYEAQNIAKLYEKELGLKIIDFKLMVYVEGQGYFPEDKVPKGSTIRNISGTEFRKMLRSGEEIPEWFSFPEIIEELRGGVEREENRGITLFFTGLSGSGKSTIANILYTLLMEAQHKKVTLLDGDVIRQNLSKGLTFSREDRNTNIERIGFVANEITKHGGVAVCSAIAPYKAAREKNRAVISKSGTYIEIYVSTPLAVCKKRDTKGFYKKAEAGLVSHFTGIDDPYEVPDTPEITIDTKKKSALNAAKDIIVYLQKKKLIPA
jgi:sulfate adenylyltransferase